MSDQLRTLLTPASWTVIAAFGAWSVLIVHQWDAHIYWGTTLDGSLYAGSWNVGTDAYVYPPPFAQAIAPLTALPWPVFATIWTIGLLAAAVWLIGPRLTALGVLAFYPLGNEIALGQINLLMASAMLIGFRFPAAWAFVLLTKITPGIGMLWFAVRREWRALWLALGVTAAICGVSFALAPDLWVAWIARMATDYDAPAHPAALVLIPLPLWFRLLAAAAITIWAARTDRAWALFLAAFIAMPLATSGRLAVVAGAVPLLQKRVACPKTQAAARHPVDVRILRPGSGHEVEAGADR